MNCLILIGKQAMERKRKKDFGGSEIESGPKSKQKRRSLKLQSQVMKKAVMPVGRTVERYRGNMEKRKKIGRRETSLSIPFGSFEAMK